MKKEKDIKKKPPKKFWWVYNQEEIAVAVCYAKTKSGALARFEDESGESREGYYATEFGFNEGCALASSVT